MHAACTVSQAVMSFQRDPAAMIIDPDQITSLVLKGHRHTEIPYILPDKGTGSVVGLKVSPEHSCPHSHLVGGKPGQSHIYRLLQYFRLDLLL
jgi:hypothetical protein